MRVRLGLACLFCTALPATDVGGTEPRTGRIVRVEHERSEMVRVPAGEFPMGVSEEEAEALLEACMLEHGAASWFCRDSLAVLGTMNAGERSVYLDSFEIDRYEVTADQFRACVAAGACDVAPLVTGDERRLRADLPMVYVTWQDARDYCTWRGKRLPTEAEWEKAARGLRGWRWPWGNHEREDGANLGKAEADAIKVTQGALVAQKFTGGRPMIASVPDASDGAQYAVPPGTLKWGAGPYGTYDMAGNVSEWVFDYYSRAGYADLSSANPVRDVPATDSGARGVRGGSWGDWKYFGRTYFRYLGRPENRSELRGFRCARDARPGGGDAGRW